VIYVVKQPSKKEAKNKEKKTKKAEKGKPVAPKVPWRNIHIITNGAQFRIVKSDATPLELREICRTIIKALGGQI